MLQNDGGLFRVCQGLELSEKRAPCLGWFVDYYNRHCRLAPVAPYPYELDLTLATNACF